MIKLYNTLTKQLEEIEKKDHVNMYTCGPTVYNYAHIGNLRSFISADLLYRTLRYDGYNPRWVMNITDIDDKTIKGTLEKFGAGATVENLREYSKFYLDEFLKDLRAVNVLVDEITVIRVTDVVPQIQEFVIGLINKGYAYTAEDGSTYFSIERYQKDFGDYGDLIGEKFLEGKKTGARVKVDEYEKDNLSDFALWKAWAPEDGQIFWDHPVLGKGRPGWHIECSVINQVGFNGDVTDIHTGGVDLVFPHHTNEIAQSQALLGKGNFVHHWFHSEFLLVEGKKMSKSLGNFYTLKDLQIKVPIAGFALRYLFMQSSYRAQQNFTQESFIGAYHALEKIYNTLKAHQIIGEHQELKKELFERYAGMLTGEDGNNLGNDLNVSGVVAIVWNVLNSMDINIHTQDEIIREFEKVLGLNLDNSPNIFEDIEIPSKVKTLVVEREQSRTAKDFAESDELRKEIESLGYEVMDTLDGQKIKKKVQL